MSVNEAIQGAVQRELKDGCLCRTISLPPDFGNDLYFKWPISSVDLSISSVDLSGLFPIKSAIRSNIWKVSDS